MSNAWTQVGDIKSIAPLGGYSGCKEARKAVLTDQKCCGWISIFGHTPPISVVFHGDLKKVLIDC